MRRSGPPVRKAPARARAVAAACRLGLCSAARARSRPTDARRSRRSTMWRRGMSRAAGRRPPERRIGNGVGPASAVVAGRRPCVMEPALSGFSKGRFSSTRVVSALGRGHGQHIGCRCGVFFPPLPVPVLPLPGLFVDRPHDRQYGPVWMPARFSIAPRAHSLSCRTVPGLVRPVRAPKLAYEPDESCEAQPMERHDKHAGKDCQRRYGGDVYRRHEVSEQWQAWRRQRWQCRSRTGRAFRREREERELGVRHHSGLLILDRHTDGHHRAVDCDDCTSCYLSRVFKAGL